MYRMQITSQTDAKTAVSLEHGKPNLGLLLDDVSTQLAGHVNSYWCGPRSFHIAGCSEAGFLVITISVSEAKLSLPLMGSVRTATVIYAIVSPSTALMLTTPPVVQSVLVSCWQSLSPNAENAAGNDTLAPGPGSVPFCQLSGSNLKQWILS